MNKSIVVDGKIFKQKEVKLSVSAPRPGKQLIGFDRSFMSNRTEDGKPIDFDLIKTHYSDLRDGNETEICLQFGMTRKVYTKIIPSLNLEIVDRTKRVHNFSAYVPYDKWHQHALNELIEAEDVETIKQWCVIDCSFRHVPRPGIQKFLEVYESENILEQIERAVNGLIYKYSEDEQIDEFKSFKRQSVPAFEKNVLSNKLVLSNQPHFYRAENEKYITDFLWRRKLIDNCKAFLYKKEHELNDREMLRQIKIAGLHNGFSQHNPLWMRSIINKYNLRSVADPTAGWGHRLIGAACDNVRYIGNDIDPDTVTGINKIAKLIGYENYTMFNHDCSEFAPEEDYEGVVTCIPYWTTEMYFGEQTSTSKYTTYEDWLNIWWRKTIRLWAKPSVRIFAVMINNQFKEDIKRVCIEEGLNFIEEIQVGKKTNLNHFQRTAQAKNEGSSKKGEQYLVFGRKT